MQDDQQEETTKMTRLSPLDPVELNPEQRAVLDAINNGPRGKGRQIGLIGPFGVYVRAPKIGMAAQALGAAARYQTMLADNVREVAICTVGAHHRAKFEFAAHAPMAAAAGVDADVIEAIRTGREPVFRKPDEAMSYRVARELLQAHRLSDDTFAEAKAMFGESALIELVSVIGYYCMVSLTLNAFEVPLLESMDDPFPG
jgi:4-carboxymuconolactone decarboxylase